MASDPAIKVALRAMLELHIAHHNHPTHAAARAALDGQEKARPRDRIPEIDLTSDAWRCTVERERRAREAGDGE